MDYKVFLVRIPGHTRPVRNTSRLLRVTDDAITISTLTPGNPAVTEYKFDKISNIKCSETDSEGFSFDAGGTTHSFVCSTRDKLVTSLYDRLDDLNGFGTDFPVQKFSNHRGEYVDVLLRLRTVSIVKLGPAAVAGRNSSALKKINLADITRVETCASHLEMLMLIHTKSRVWQVLCDGNIEQLASGIQQNAKTHLYRHIPVQQISRDDVLAITNARTEALRGSPILYEFSVVKNSDAASGMQRERTVVLTREFMAELSGSQVVALHSLHDILGLVVSDKNELEVVVEFASWRATQYFVTEREAFVGSLAEVASQAHLHLPTPSAAAQGQAGTQGQSKGGHFSIRLEPLAPFTLPEKPLPLFQNEHEISLIARFMTIYMAHKDKGALTSPEVQRQWAPILKEYACNMQPGDSLCMDGRPMLAVGDILKACLELKSSAAAAASLTCCTVIQRLLGTKPVFESVKSNPDFVKILIKAVKHPVAMVSYAAAAAMRSTVRFCASDIVGPDGLPATARPATTTVSSFLMQSFPSAAEAANKQAVLNQENLQVLVARLQTDALVHQKALQVQGILEVLTLALCLPADANAEAEKQWMEMVESSLLVAADVLSILTRSRSSIMYCSNAVLVKTIFQRCTPSFVQRFQAVLHARGVPLLLLNNALFNKIERARTLSADLLFALAEANPAIQQLLANTLPLGFFYVLKDRAEAAQQQQQTPGAATQQAKALEADPSKSLRVSLSSSIASAAVFAAAAAAVNPPSTAGTTLASFSLTASLPGVPGTLAGGEGALGAAGGAGGAGGGAGGKQSAPSVWREALEMLRRDTIETPVLVWNDAKRQELHGYLKDQIEQFDYTLSRQSNGKDVHFNVTDAECVYSPVAEKNEVSKTIVAGVHLDLLLESPVEASPELASHWKLEDPSALFTSVLQALVVCFTPLYGTCDLPEVEPRLAVDALTWIYERHHEELMFTVENLKVVEMFVAMLREAIENDHVVFAFKALILLKIMLEHGGRTAANRFVKASGVHIIVPLIVSCLAKSCKDESVFECDAPSVKDRSSAAEVVPVVGVDGDVRNARVPAGRAAREGPGPGPAGGAVHGSSVEARVAIKWRDENVPEKLIIGSAMELLETVLEICDPSSGPDCFPPPSPFLALSETELFFSVVQLLLRAKAPLFRRVLDVLSSLVKANKAVVPELYKFGTFEFLLWKLIAGDITADDRLRIVKFLSRTHLHQEPVALSHASVKGLVVVEHLPWQDSILRLYLPPGLVAKLIQEGPELFLDNFTADDTDSPEVVWSDEMRERLRDFLEADLEPYVQSRAADPHSMYMFTAKDPVVYPEIAGTIFVAPVYLHNILDPERFPVDQLFDATSFHQAVVKEYERIHSTTSTVAGGAATWRQEAPRLVLLLKAQAVILERQPDIPLSAEAESVIVDIATPALRTCIAQRDDCPALTMDLLQHAAKILKSIAATRDKDADVSQTSINFALSILSCGTRVKSDGSLPDSAAASPLEPALAAAMAILQLAASTPNGRAQLRDDVRWRKGFWWALCSAASEVAGSPDSLAPCQLAFEALDCLCHFAGDRLNCGRVVKQALLLPLLLLVVPTEAMIEDENRKVEMGREPNLRYKALQQVAAQVLRILALTLDATAAEEEEDEDGRRLSSGVDAVEKGLLDHIVPIGLLEALKSSDSGVGKFVALVSADCELPTAIWSAPVREELRSKVLARLQRFNLVQAGGQGAAAKASPLAGREEDEMAWLKVFRYDCLRHELAIAGVFVRGYAAGTWEAQDLAGGDSFLESLQDYLRASLFILSPSLPKPKKKPRSECAASPSDFVTVMRALGVCVRAAVDSGKRGVLAQLSFSLLSRILLSASRLPSARMLVVAIARSMAGAPGSREQLLRSSLLPAMAELLWRSLGTLRSDGNRTPGGLGSGSTGEDDFAEEYQGEMAVAILDAVFDLTVEMAAVVAMTNLFSSSGLLLVLLALFFRCPLPPFPGQDEREAVEAWRLMAEEGTMDTLQFRAAQILGQLLMAACGVQDRARFITSSRDGMLSGAFGDSLMSSLGSPGLNGEAGGKRVSKWAYITGAATPALVSETEGLVDMGDMMGGGGGILMDGPDGDRADDEIHGDMVDIVRLLAMLEPGATPTVPLVTVRILYVLLPVHVMALLARDPDLAIQALTATCATPLLVWSPSSARRSRDVIGREAAKLLLKYKGYTETDWAGWVEAADDGSRDEEEGGKGKKKVGLPKWTLSRGAEDGPDAGSGSVATLKPFFLRLVHESAVMRTGKGDGEGEGEEVLNNGEEEEVEEDEWGEDEAGDSLTPKVPLFSDTEETGYVNEIYVSGCFVDQLLRCPDFNLSPRLELRLIRELRKAVVAAAPTDGKRRETASVSEKRRLLLCLLALFRQRPHLLTISNTTDLFLPVCDFFASGKGDGPRVLVQPGLLLLAAMVAAPDVADFVATGELLSLLSRLLLLDVPPGRQGRPATDPRVCALMLFRRLFTLSTTAVRIGMDDYYAPTTSAAAAAASGKGPDDGAGSPKAFVRTAVMDRVAAVVLDMENAVAVRAQAAAVLLAMTRDRRVGEQALKVVEKMVPEIHRTGVAWKMGLRLVEEGCEGAATAIVTEETLRYLLRHPKPCSDWWTVDVPDDESAAEALALHDEDEEDPVGGKGGNKGVPTSVIDTSLLFPGARLDAWTEEVEGCLRYSLAAAAGTTARHVRVLRKRPGGNGVTVELELQFQAGLKKGGAAPALAAAAAAVTDGRRRRQSMVDPEKAAKAFKVRLEGRLTQMLDSTVFGPFKNATVRSATVRSWGR